MRDIEEETNRRIACWNERFVACWKGKYTQTQLAEALNRKYQTSFTQKAINRYMHVGDPKRGLIGFPEYETMLIIADFFNVDVGYLTGETDAESFTEEKVSSYLGINTEAVKVIKNATDDDFHISHLIHPSTETIRQVFNRFLTAKGFPEFVYALTELASVYEKPNTIKDLWEEAEKRFGENLLSEAMEHRDDTEEDNPNPRPELLEAIYAVNDIIDKSVEVRQKQEFYSDVFKFRLLHVYNKMIDELYPPNSNEKEH